MMIDGGVVRAGLQESWAQVTGREIRSAIPAFARMPGFDWPCSSLFVSLIQSEVNRFHESYPFKRFFQNKIRTQL